MPFHGCHFHYAMKRRKRGCGREGDTKRGGVARQGSDGCGSDGGLEGIYASGGVVRKR